ncbi:hypothetical protein QT602_22635, partial [Xanthomonas citri pv. citri]
LYRLQNADWSSVGTVLYRLESVNGFGYRTHNVKSPFLWACTNLYTSGKFVGDHTFDPSFKDTQCGAAALLKVLVQRKVVELP